MVVPHSWRTTHKKIGGKLSLLLIFFPIASLLQMKVPFEEVPELVAGRRVFIHKGHAYIAANQVSVNTCYEFWKSSYY